MKCPKCGYLGFETVNRCRNCGYDFSMSADRADAELTLRDGKDTPSPLSDLELADERPGLGGKGALDLDRLIGVPDEVQGVEIPEVEIPEIEPMEPVIEPVRIVRPPAVNETPLLDAAERAASRAAERTANLPLFSNARATESDRGEEEQAADEQPFVAAPRPAGPPLAVRRATPEVARPRTRGARSTPRNDPGLSFSGDTSFSASDVDEGEAFISGDTSPFQAAPRIRRIVAALIDLVLLVGICVGVLYLTLRLAELTFDDIRVLPVVPMGAFLVLLVVGYLIAFTAAGGQTIGKMATHIRVIADDGRPVDVSGAALRVAGNAIQILTLGLAWLPALFAADGRGIADRIAGTRVVRA